MNARAYGAAAVVGVVVLLALVAVASGSGWSAGDGETPAVPRAFADYAYTTFVLLLAALIPFAIYLLAKGRVVLVTLAGQKISLLRGLSVLFGALVVAAAIARDRGIGGAEGSGGSGAGDGAAGLEPGTSPSFRWELVVLVGLAAGAFALRQWSAPKRPVDAAEIADALVDEIDGALADLEGEDDPRRAVIAAYARMERTLAAHGVPRRPAEAPLEYLGRVLAELRVGAPAVEALTDLFEQAKFSLHDVDIRMKTDAIAALAAVRGDLQPAAAA